MNEAKGEKVKRGKGEEGKTERPARRRPRAFFPFPFYPFPFFPFYPSPFSPVALVAFALLLLLPACAIDERRSGLPPTAQDAIDRLTEHLAERRFAEIHAEAADEWRAAATADASRAVLERARETLGRVVSRAPVRAAEQQNSSGELRGHTLSLTYNTKFERAEAIEQLTLVERDGRWQLARYTVNSDALK
jgi:hypothetical protein